MMPIHLLAGALIALSLPLTAPHARALEVDRSIAKACAECHGIDGNSTNPKYPKLAGQGREYLVAQLQAFRDQSRKDPSAHASMSVVGKSLSDDHLAKLATYFTLQKPAPGQPADKELAAKGKAIFERGIRSRDIPACAFCHGRLAQGTTQIPRLAGQHAAYLESQMKVFHLKYRPTFALSMKAVVERLNEDEARQVAAYLQGL